MGEVHNGTPNNLTVIDHGHILPYDIDFVRIGHDPAV